MRHTYHAVWPRNFANEVTVYRVPVDEAVAGAEYLSARYDRVDSTYQRVTARRAREMHARYRALADDHEVAELLAEIHMCDEITGPGEGER